MGAMIGWTFCSGIGAPEMAAPWVDWRLASEIEPFPRAVLADRFGYRAPEDHNQGDPLLWGDFTEINPEMARARGVPLPDLIVAGTPCQAFSIAGLRKGVADDRGNLTLKFVETCHAIVDARPDGKLAVLWENVPGVLSDKNNAFGCFLGGIVGSMDALRSPDGGIWPREGMVQGPRARAAWAVLDARWFGVAQRRRRVFVVIDFGNCVDPSAVLLEPDRLRGDHPPRGQAGQGFAADVAPCLRACGVGVERIGDTCGQDPVVAITSTGDVSHCPITMAVADQWAVRRLMPVECARLQGFPDDHTAITYRGKPAADGPQYKAYGNSTAVPVVRWILGRVQISTKMMAEKEKP